MFYNMFITVAISKPPPTYGFTRQIIYGLNAIKDVLCFNTN